MPWILPPAARRRYWHGRYSAGAATDPGTLRGALAPRTNFSEPYPLRADPSNQHFDFCPSVPVLPHLRPSVLLSFCPSVLLSCPSVLLSSTRSRYLRLRLQGSQTGAVATSRRGKATIQEGKEARCE